MADVPAASNEGAEVAHTTVFVRLRRVGDLRQPGNAGRDSRLFALLDLPELALEEIGKHLGARDLVCCMRACKALKTAYEPRLRATVLARRFGRRWLLRSCGRALFRAVAQRWEAGEITFDSDINDDSFDPLPAYIVSLQKTLGREAIASRDGLRASWLTLKSRSKNPDFTVVSAQHSFPIPLVFGEYFLYLCNLAEERGFGETLRLLERVWALAATKFTATCRVDFRRWRDLPVSTPHFFTTYDVDRGAAWSPFRIPERVLSTSFVFLPPEMMSVIWLLAFLVRLDMDAEETLGALGEMKEKMLAFGAS